MKTRNLELYLHIPFCVKKCAYCDFLSAPANAAERQNYVDALLREIQMSRNPYREFRVTTIFIGGGTPSVLSAEQMASVFCALRDHFDIDPDAEVTIEVNPGTVTEEKAAAWKRAGINRISIGLQSVNDRELQMLGRIHSYQEFLKTYELLRRTGFSNVNIDLISAIPGQTTASWEKTLRSVAELRPEHISAYSLIIEEGTPFYEKYGDGNEELPDEETERIMYEATDTILRQYGYHRYEISNYAKKGYQCRHNEGYWRRAEYLGLGLGAASLVGSLRFRNVSDYTAYREAIKSGKGLHEEIEELTPADEMAEFMFLGLRMMEGVSKRTFLENFGVEMNSIYGAQLEKLEGDGLLINEKDQVRLTRRGIDISNYVFEKFLIL